ncbi:MAG: DUF92 domain-containing protein [Gemmatimonadales bacterium]
MFDWLLALALAGGVSATAWRLGALRFSGVVAGTLVGAVVLGFAGLGAAAVLVLFFVTASALSRLPPAGERSARNARQVLANGSVAAVAAALSGIGGSLALTAFLGAVAAATADTWATEIGVRWGRRPRSLLTLQPQPPGTSGAVSLAGTGAALIGALAVGLAGHGWVAGIDGHAGLAVALAGFGGSLVDSLLGAGPQAEYRCGRCGASPQVASHEGCPVAAERIAGVPGLDNDAVNWIATGVGASLALLLSRLL